VKVELPITPTEVVETAEASIPPTEVKPSRPRKKKLNKIRIKQSEGDPKLAQKILDLAEGK